MPFVKMGRRTPSRTTLALILLPGLLLLVFWQRALHLPATIMPDVEQGRFSAALPPIEPPHTIGQQFVATHPNLSAIELLVVVYERDALVFNRPSPILFHLYRDGPYGSPVKTEVKGANQLEHNQKWRITFPPEEESEGQKYYFWLEGVAGSQVGLWYSPLDLYKGGDYQFDHQPAGGDLTFVTYYSYDASVFWRELGEILQAYGGTALFVILLLLLPGWMMSRWALSDRDLDSIEQLALAFGFSLALFPLLFLWATVLHDRLERSWLILAYLICLFAGLLWLVNRILKRPRAFKLHMPALETIIGLLFLAAILVVRLVQIRELQTPPGLDAPHHALIATLVSNSGRVPTSFMPMLPIEIARYHFGFHTTAAAMQWLTGASLTSVILVLGQIINAAISLGMYFITLQLTGRRHLALLSLILSGLVSPFPAYYLHWGRYTVISGLLLLTVAIGFTIILLRRPSRRLWAAGALLWSGLFLTHYNMLALAVCFVAVYAFYTYWSECKLVSRRPFKIAQLVPMISLALILSLPWLYHLGSSLGIEGLEVLISHDIGEGAPSLGLLSRPPFPWLIILAGLGTLLGLWRQRHWVVILWLWILLAGAAANIRLFGMLQGFVLNNGAFLLAAFVPVVILAGYLIDGGYRVANRLVSPTGQTRGAKIILWAVVGTAVCLLLVRITWQQLPLLDRSIVTVTEADVAAMSWIRERTAEDALFLTNSWNQPGQMTVGPDAGVWIPILTGRQVTLPPITYGQGSLAYRSEVEGFAQSIQDAALSNSIDDDTIRKKLGKLGVSHVYVGARPGAMTPAELQQSPYYNLVFSNGPVSIFEFEPAESAGDVETFRPSHEITGQAYSAR